MNTIPADTTANSPDDTTNNNNVLLYISKFKKRFGEKRESERPCDVMAQSVRVSGCKQHSAYTWTENGSEAGAVRQSRER